MAAGEADSSPAVNYVAGGSGLAMQVGGGGGGEEGRRASRAPRPVGSELAEGASEGQLDRLEQRTVGEHVYSNYIKIKCSSLVAAVGYEMTSELSVPLTLFVPAHQLSDATATTGRQRRPGAGSGGSAGDEARGARQGGGSDAAGGRRQQAGGGGDDDESGLFGVARAIRNGGSLQAPRAVLIDRLAQASTPSSKSAVANSTFGATNQRAAGAPTNKPRARANERTQTISNQRSMYLDELAKRSKSGE